MKLDHRKELEVGSPRDLEFGVFLRDSFTEIQFTCHTNHPFKA